MRIFDAQIRSEARPTRDLRNLAYFGTTHVVTTLRGQPVQNADAWLAAASTLMNAELARIRDAGLSGACSLGMLRAAAPKRAHPELWRMVPDLLADPKVVAIGEVGAFDDTRPEWDLFERWVRLAMEHGKPLVVTPPQDLRVNMTFKMMQRLNHLGVPPERVVFNHVEGRTLEAVRADGYLAALTVGPYHLSVIEAAELVEAAGGEGMMLNTSTGEGVADILSLPKLLAELAGRGVRPEALDELAFRSAARFFGTYQDVESASPDASP